MGSAGARPAAGGGAGVARPLDRRRPPDLHRRPAGAAGFANAFGAAGGSRYPHVDLATIRAAADLVILPDEPYAFGAADGPECFSGADGAAAVDTVCIDGRAITWYGPAMVAARADLEEVLAPWRG